MHLSDGIADHVFSCSPFFQQSASRFSAAVQEKTAEVSTGPHLLKRQHQAARHVGAALASDRVTEFLEVGYAEIYPGFRQSLFLLDQDRAMKQQPVTDRSMPLLQTITPVLPGHREEKPLPPAQPQAVLGSFLHAVDDSDTTALQPAGYDPCIVLAQQQESDGLRYRAVGKEVSGLAEGLLNKRPASFYSTGLHSSENDENVSPLRQAAKNSDESAARQDLEKRADTGFRGQSGRSCRHCDCAACQRRDDIFPILLVLFMYLFVALAMMNMNP